MTKFQNRPPFPVTTDRIHHNTALLYAESTLSPLLPSPTPEELKYVLLISSQDGGFFTEIE